MQTSPYNLRDRARALDEQFDADDLASLFGSTELGDWIIAVRDLLGEVANNTVSIDNIGATLVEDNETKNGELKKHAKVYLAVVLDLSEEADRLRTLGLSDESFMNAAITNVREIFHANNTFSIDTIGANLLEDK